ncbi:drug/metabolite exporter YedA [Methylotenera sp.]|uniref:drug/metabolite exporter YedA n=1 Tax=Methylotenera sp. TaxID=2051956 RepID=UPI002727FC3F|nr:drug/metabolite exporter YedA [Methylotenera sp.]MDO9205237.1 drug/metabolite exporter YedA [Methylotenera sp.]MDO9394454.1 drug/metabolite exporter YedA [Methylotenera sp.]MDP2070799.1 drug/metabolite exporter YedA [Methylotenera sp.]MDP2231339.1 drug/metabolite exporter YedA [Methylotenera sp.]MDP3004720.1 drug/metabolite exporter YedA [Methylotenera sp.]
MKIKNQGLLIVLALFCTYFIWGSTYLAIRFGIESFPPFLMAGVRFTIAGAILYCVMRFFGAPNPTRQQWLGATAVGIFLPALGNGTVCYVQQTVSSSVAALSIATAPIWMAIFSSIWGHKITSKEWLGIAVGLAGIVLLNVGGSLHGELASAMLLIFAAASWSFGSVWSKRLDMPDGLMASASQMLAGGVVLLMVSSLQGETWPQTISQKSWGAMLFLVVLGSLVAYSAYQYLLKTVRPLVASSNTFVNPVVAFIVGIWFANEHVTTTEFIALGVILIGVFLVLSASNKEI